MCWVSRQIFTQVVPRPPGFSNRTGTEPGPHCVPILNGGPTVRSAVHWIQRVWHPEPVLRSSPSTATLSKTPSVSTGRVVPDASAVPRETDQPSAATADEP